MTLVIMTGQANCHFFYDKRPNTRAKHTGATHATSTMSTELAVAADVSSFLQFVAADADSEAEVYTQMMNDNPEVSSTLLVEMSATKSAEQAGYLAQVQGVDSDSDSDDDNPNSVFRMACKNDVMFQRMADEAGNIVALCKEKLLELNGGVLPKMKHKRGSTSSAAKPKVKKVKTEMEVKEAKAHQVRMKLKKAAQKKLGDMVAEDGHPITIAIEHIKTLNNLCKTNRCRETDELVEKVHDDELKLNEFSKLKDELVLNVHDIREKLGLVR